MIKSTCRRSPMNTNAVSRVGSIASYMFTGLLLYFAATSAGLTADLRSNASMRNGIVRGTLHLSGRIDRDDYKRVSEAIRSFLDRGQDLDLTVYVNSVGGDVDTSIRIGRLLRKFDATVWVHSSAQCLSSCVFVLAGGDIKIVMNKASVGIHRPYISDISVDPSYKDVRFLYSKTQEQARKYLEDMNISPILIDEMFSIPPESIRLLSKAELERFGLNRPDPIRQEMRDISAARRLGISREDYLRRRGRLDIVCDVYRGDSAKMDMCIADVMDGRR